MSETPLLECRGVTKSFAQVHALVNVDFDVRRGEVMALVGDNGAGKSTLIKCIAGIYAFDEQRLEVLGGPVAILDGMWIPQPTLSAWFGVSDNGTLVYRDSGGEYNERLVIVDRPPEGVRVAERQDARVRVRA